MIGVVALYTLASFISPQEGDIWSVNETYEVRWYEDHTAHIELEMLNNNTWEHRVNGINFLSTIADDNEFDWNIPIYLSQFWHYPKRMKGTDMGFSRTWYSGVFNTTGLSIDNYDIIDNELILNWTTNVVNKKYNIYLYGNDTTYLNYQQQLPITVLMLDNEYNYCKWELPEDINDYFVILVSTVDKLVLDLLGPLELKYDNTSVSPLAPGNIPGGHIPHEPPRGTIDSCYTSGGAATCAGWIVLIIVLILVSILIVYCFVSYYCIVTSNVVYPEYSNRTSNPLYQHNRSEGAVVNTTYSSNNNDDNYGYQIPDDVDNDTLVHNPVYVIPGGVSYRDSPIYEEDIPSIQFPSSGTRESIVDHNEKDMVCLQKSYSSYGMDSPPPTCWERPVTPKSSKRKSRC